jgi:hypothetical protein
MKRKIWLLALVGAVLLSAGTAWAQDEFYVIAAGPTAVGTKITSLPYTISTPGFYYLTGNLSYSGIFPGITVNSDDVTLDLMGFSLSGPGSGPGPNAICMPGRKNVEIRNGTVSGWAGGIYDNTLAALRYRVINMRVENATDGIHLYGGGHLIKGCTVGDCGCAIFLGGAGSIIGNTVIAISGQIGIYIISDMSDPVLMDQNAVSGAGSHFIPAGTGIVKTANNAF